jgi:hypothetical protein
MSVFSVSICTSISYLSPTRLSITSCLTIYHLSTYLPSITFLSVSQSPIGNNSWILFILIIFTFTFMCVHYLDHLFPMDSYFKIVQRSLHAFSLSFRHVPIILWACSCFLTQSQLLWVLVPAPVLGQPFLLGALVPAGDLAHRKHMWTSLTFCRQMRPLVDRSLPWYTRWCERRHRRWPFSSCLAPRHKSAMCLSSHVSFWNFIV